MTDTRTAVQAFLDAQGIKFAATGGQRTLRDDWECFQWEVKFSRLTNLKQSFSTQFYCGLGHIKANRYPVGHWARSEVPVPPTAADVLYSLLSDSEARNQSFADWCADLGYDSDSIKALNTYNACVAADSLLREVFTHTERDQLAHMLEGY